MADLIVEDGSIVPDANTYADLATVRAYCDARGLIIPDGDDELSQMIFIAMDYIEAMETRFKGHRVSPLQNLAWPRSGVVIICGQPPLPDNTIPKNLINALCQLTADAAANDGELNTNVTEFAVRQETVGPLTTIYATGGSNSGSTTQPFQPIFTKFNNFMKPLLIPQSGGVYR